MQRHFADDAILGWPVVKGRSRLRGSSVVARALGQVFRARGFLAMQVVRAAAAAILIVLAGHSVARPVALFTLVLINLLTHLRHFGLASTGGDRLRLVILGALTLRELAPHSAAAAYAALAFIAGQCALAYFVAGVAKLNKQEWKSGAALAVLLRSSLMGDAAVAKWLEHHSRWCQLFTWGALALELGFPVALLGGEKVAIVFVAAAWAMQIAIGQLMGLAPFVWAFLAAYPAILLISGKISGWIWR